MVFDNDNKRRSIVERIVPLVYFEFMSIINITIKPDVIDLNLLFNRGSWHKFNQFFKSLIVTRLHCFFRIRHCRRE